MADRVYSVRYDIVAEAGKAIETFNSLQNPLYNLKRNSQKLSSSLMTTVERLTTLKETLDKISSTSRNIEISVTFDIASFNRNLKEMELNARASANRIRGTFESVFKDTHGDYMRKQSLLGTPIEQGVSSGDKELRKRLKKENKTVQSLIGKMREARKQADIYTIAKRNLAGNVSEKDAISSISSIWKGFGKTSLASLKKKIREGAYDTTVLLDKAEKELWRSLNAGALAPLENGSFLNLVDVARDNTDKIFKAIEERRRSNIANIASVQKEQKDIAKNTKPLMGSQKVVPGQPFLSEISANPREIAKISEAYTKMLRNISKIGNKSISVNVRGNYRSHMESLAEFAKTMPLLKSRTVKVNVNVSGLSKTSLSKIKELSGITDKKVPVSLTLSYKNARDQVPRTLGLLQRIVNEGGGVKIQATIDRTKVGGQLSSLIRNLRTLVAENRLTIPVNLQSVDVKKPKNVPTINVKAKVTGLTNAIREANTAFQKRVATMKNSPAIRIPVQLKWGNGKENMQAQIKKMQSSIPSLKVGVNLELAKAQIDELAAYIQKKGIINLGAMSGPKSQGPFRNYRPGSGESFAAGAVGGGRRGSGGGDSGGRVYSGGGEGGNFLTRLRRFAYPLTGNLSYGASSPMALQMFKDMPIMMGVGGAIGAVTNGIGQAFEYQDTMRVARSILERSYKGNNFEKDYRNMELTARNVARNTKFTGKEAADAVRFMAMAGLDIPKINSSIKPIADIALIGRNNLGDIADIMTNVQTTYKIPADKMERMADAMANTFTKTNVDMMMIAESLKYAGGIAQLTGTSLGDSLAMIGIMGNNGIQGSMAGTSTRMMMQNMIRPNKGQAAMWKSLGISTTDEHGFVKDPIKLLGELKGYVDKKYGSKEYMELGKGEEFKNKALGTLVSNMFRVTSTAGVAALLRDYDKLVELSESNKSSSINGLSSRLSGFQQNEVKGLVAKVSSSLQEQILQIIEKNTGWIKQKLIEANEWMSSPETKSKLESLIETLKNIVDGFINVGRVALWAYEKFNSIKIFGNGLVDFLIKFQLYMTAIGSTLRLVLSPLNIFSGFNFGGGMGAAGAGAAMGGTGFAAFAGTGIASLFNSRRRRGFSRDGYENLGSDFARTVSAGHHRKINTGFKGVHSLEDLYLMELAVGGLAVGGENSYLARTAATSASIRRRAIKIAKIKRRRDQLLDSELISEFIMSRGFKRSKGLIGESLRANFRAGKAFGAFKSVAGFEGLASTITSGVMGLAKAIGLLLSPIGLATMAIGALGVTLYGFYKRNKRWSEQQKEREKRSETVQKIAASNQLYDLSSVKYLSDLSKDNPFYVSSSGINGATTNKVWSRAGNPLLKNNTLFHDILNPGNDAFTSFSYKKYLGGLYNDYIANGWNHYSENAVDVSRWQNRYGDFVFDDNNIDNLRGLAFRGATMLSGASTNRVKQWKNKVTEETNRILSIKDVEKRNAEWSKLQEKVNDFGTSLEKQAKSLKSVTELQDKYGNNIGDIRSSSLANTLEYRLGEARQIKSLISDIENMAANQYAASHIIDANAKNKNEEAIKGVIGMLGLKFNGDKGEFTTGISFDKKGNINWEKLQQTLKDNGVDFKLSFENKIGIIENLLGRIKDMPYFGSVTNYLELILHKMQNPGSPTQYIIGYTGEDSDNVPESIRRNRLIGVQDVVPKDEIKDKTSEDVSNFGNKNSYFRSSPFKKWIQNNKNIQNHGKGARAEKLSYTNESMGNYRYLSHNIGGSSSTKLSNVVVNVGGINNYSDTDPKEIENMIREGVVTAIRACFVDQDNASYQTTLL